MIAWPADRASIGASLMVARPTGSVGSRLFSHHDIGAMVMRNASKLLTVRTDPPTSSARSRRCFRSSSCADGATRPSKTQRSTAAHRSCLGLSRRTISPSLAVDPRRIRSTGEDRDRFILLAGHVLAVANKRGLKVRWGGDWNGNLVVRDERFQDLGHFEVLTEEMMKTTVAGIITIIAAILSVVATLLIGARSTGAPSGPIVAAVGLIAGGVGLLKASDDPAQK